MTRLADPNWCKRRPEELRPIVKELREWADERVGPPSLTAFLERAADQLEGALAESNRCERP